jgi:protein gp37
LKIIDGKFRGRWNGQVRFIERHLEDPLRWKRPRRIFVNSMSDLFHEEVKSDWIAAIFSVIEASPRHTFQILTKRPERMREWVAPFDAWLRYAADTTFALRFKHVWLGVSVEDQATAGERIPILLRTPAAVRWVSYEPALGPLNLAEIETGGEALLDWLVCGGESGPGARPMHPDWARAARDQCFAASVPFFFKQWGEYASVSEVAGNGLHFTFEDGATVRRLGKKLAGRMLDGREWNEMPAVNR